jgi:hypothetical protein
VLLGEDVTQALGAALVLVALGIVLINRPPRTATRGAEQRRPA